jgi:hypothetical protein
MQARLTAAALVAAGAGVALPTPWGALVAATVYGVLIIAMGFARPLVYGRND